MWPACAPRLVCLSSPPEGSVADARGAAADTGLQKLGPFDAPEGYVTTEVCA